MKRTPLTRKVPVSRARDTSTYRTRLKPRSAKTIAAAEEHRDVRMALFARDHGRCLIEGVRGHPFCAGPWTPHHLVKAWKGGAYDLTNLVTICAYGNGQIEDAPGWAHDLGLVVRNGETPADALARRIEAGLTKG